MNLYRVGGGQHKILLGTVKTSEEVAQLLIADGRSRFSIPKGKLNLEEMAVGLVYTDSMRGGLKYFLEEETSNS